MKIYLVIVVLFLTMNVFGQSQIILRGGEKIGGEVKSLINGVFTVKFKGNDITLKQSEIESISFVEKSSQDPSAHYVNDKAELKGVVTYFFNKNYGDKPDVGAVVYLTKTDTTNKKESFLQKYQKAKICRDFIKYDTDGYCSKTLKHLNADTKEGFDKLNTDAVKELLDVKYSEDIIKITVDGTGNYAVSVQPGLYEIIFISNGRTDSTLVEVQGKVETQIIYLKSGDTKIIDKRFGL